MGEILPFSLVRAETVLGHRTKHHSHHVPLGAFHGRFLLSLARVGDDVA
jgi:hypothetical protein